MYSDSVVHPKKNDLVVSTDRVWDVDIVLILDRYSDDWQRYNSQVLMWEILIFLKLCLFIFPISAKNNN